MTDHYLSRDKAHLARLQRERRSRLTRIDYMPSDAALKIIDAKRATLPEWGGLSTNSATIDAILTDWAELTGIKYGEVVTLTSSTDSPERCDEHTHADTSPYAKRPTRAQEFGQQTGISAVIAGVRAGAYDFGWLAPRKATQTPRTEKQRVTCGAKRHRDGQPCQAKSEPGKRRCRFHGGRSTGPKTPEGKARALANLRRTVRGVAPV